MEGMQMNARALIISFAVLLAAISSLAAEAIDPLAGTAP
jgi:hypothetical protein